ncbi:hypothetical protein [Corynebacterium silvaticum]|uniref:hypothetical protein n=1 Tax=Corynebacterium silvaticum TaxID=2320431 RepID=UPI00141A1A9B|nr:hypothetical protein [Corynebacterium silvaticum]MBH5299246.1 hypothetical protein [Corynebacterium silvaticum]NOM64434.1 hypothetical protein [Corynebacterium silvaticum]
MKTENRIVVPMVFVVYTLNKPSLERRIIVGKAYLHVSMNPVKFRTVAPLL